MFFKFNFEFIAVPQIDKTIQKYFGENMPSIKDIYKRLSLLMTGANPILDNIRPLVPNVITMEFIHIGEAQPLPIVRLQ